MAAYTLWLLDGSTLTPRIARLGQYGIGKREIHPGRGGIHRAGEQRGICKDLRAVAAGENIVTPPYRPLGRADRCRCREFMASAMAMITSDPPFVISVPVVKEYVPDAPPAALAMGWLFPYSRLLQVLLVQWKLSSRKRSASSRIDRRSGIRGCPNKLL